MRPCLILLLLFAAPPTVNAQTPPPSGRWEYGTLTIIGGTASSGPPVLNWTTADSEHVTLVKRGPKDPATYVPFVTLLNRLGAEGWELVVAQPKDPLSGSTQYLAISTQYVFKRRKQ